jgi:hypothetical protein
MCDFFKKNITLFSSVSISEKLFIEEDLNRHVGSTRIGFDGGT